MALANRIADRLLLILVAALFSAIVLGIALIFRPSQSASAFVILGCFYFLISSWWNFEDIRKLKHRSARIVLLVLVQTIIIVTGYGLLRFSGFSWPEQGGAWITLPIMYAMLFATFIAFDTVQRYIFK